LNAEGTFEKEYPTKDAAFECGILGWIDKTFSDSKGNSTIELSLATPAYLMSFHKNFIASLITIKY